MHRSRLPPLRALLAFEAAARHASFSQGAEELGVTASAISHQIQILEDFLGIRLFRRHAGRVVLTQAGETYARQIAHAFGVIAGATELVAPQSQAGHLVVAAGLSFATRWLQPRLPAFLEQHPDIRLRLSTLSDHADLDLSRFDIAICYGRPASSTLQIEPLIVEKLRPYCAPTMVDALKLYQITDLTRATLIHSINALTWSDYLRRVGCERLKPAQEIWLDRSTMAIDAAVAGLGVALESELLVASDLISGRLVAPFPDPSLEVDIPSYFLVRSKGQRGGVHLAAFERWLRCALVQEA